ncbi:iron-containing alcohol dehydrogenase family protein [Serratia fonticola]|uniref:Iron-containing alcohol dehydrogenase family protein n=1 Tax=Serratia fonticola TaxID=47917 RepID=A0AAJ1YH61_SERFO|nr:iron-containing alcohol dehydrogenase family protein [Serratia fonticola]MDQ9130215.1 iron-containing alcohol dehydrogenase family protein [Serratia fonticola]
MLAIKSPQSYHHQPGLRARVGEYIASRAKNISIITSPQAWQAVNPELEASLQQHQIRYRVSFLAGECSGAAIANHRAQVTEQAATLVMGIGGGRVLDCAKAVANGLQNVAVVTMPTQAATCAAWSPLSIIYNEHGGFERRQTLSDMPLLVLVDSEVIARSNVRYLKAGIVDALAKWYEFRPYQQVDGESLSLNLKVQVAQLALDVFEQYGAQAISDNARHQVTPELIKVIDANIALAGLVNSMRGATPTPGLAHAIHDRLTHQGELHEWLHGEKVGFGLLVQSLLENGNAQADSKLLSLLHEYDAPLILPSLQGDRRTVISAIAREVKFTREDDAAHLLFAFTASTIEEALLATENRF